MNGGVRFFLVIGMIAVLAGTTDAYALFSKKTKAKKDAAATTEKAATMPAAVAGKKSEPDSSVKPVVENKADVPAGDSPEMATQAHSEALPADAPVAVPRNDTAKKNRDAKRAQLENTRWEIELIPMSGKGEHSKDALVFQNNQIFSENGEQRGLPATNYTLTVQDEQVIWETMQTSPKGQTVFWRGELDASLQEMRGVMSWQVEPGKSEDYSFLSRKKTTVTEK